MISDFTDKELVASVGSIHTWVVPPYKVPHVKELYLRMEDTDMTEKELGDFPLDIPLLVNVRFIGGDLPHLLVNLISLRGVETKRYQSPDDLPYWIKQKLSLLMMVSPNKDIIKGVGTHRAYNRFILLGEPSCDPRS